MASGSVEIAPKSGTIPTNTDLNNVTDIGTYWLNGSYTYTNVPESRSYGLLEVMKQTPTGSIIVQRFHYSWNTSTSNRGYVVYERMKPSSSWYPWYKVTGTYVG